MSMSDGYSYLEGNKLIVPWLVEEKFNLQLLTPEEYNQLPLGTPLGCIDGRELVKSLDSDESGSPNYVDMDTRGGRLAYGLIYERFTKPKMEED